MAEVQLSNLAALDLESIFQWTIEKFGLAQAELYKTDLGGCLKRIGGDPRLGRKLERSDRFLFFTCRRHVIFFSITDETIFVVRVLHASMDFARHLPKR